MPMAKATVPHHGPSSVEKASSDLAAAESNFGVAPSDLAAERHGDDHAQDDDDRGSDTDADDAQLVVIQLFVEPRHEPLVASSIVGLRFRHRGDGAIAGGGGAGATVGTSGRQLS